MPITKAERTIATLEDWKQYAPPKSEHHWVNGRSAKEVARAWLSESGTDLPAEVKACLEVHARFGPVLSWECEPEAKLRFDNFPGEPRNSDLLVDAIDSFGPYVIAVEAKADETYGETMADAFAAAIERFIDNPRSNGVARIQGLAGLLFRSRTDAAPKVAFLRYQLMTACAAAVAEASRKNTSRAIMLVHEFVTPVTDDEKHRRNLMDLQSFVHRLSGDVACDLKNEQLYGPINLPSAPGVDLFIGKVTRNIRPL